MIPSHLCHVEFIQDNAYAVVEIFHLWLIVFFFLLMQQEDRSAKLVEDQPPGNLPYLKPDDVQYFDKLLVSWKSPRL